MSKPRTGLLSLLVRRNAILIVAFTAAGLLQWTFIKLVALSQAPDEFGRFVAVVHLVLVFSTPLVSLQGGVSRQVAAWIAAGRRGEIRPWLRQRLRAWSLPLVGLAVVLFVAAGPLARSLDLGDPAALVILIAIVFVLLPFQALLGTFAGSERLGILAGLILLDTSGRCLLAVLLPDVVATTTGALGVSLVALAAATLAGWGALRRVEPATTAAQPSPSVVPSFLFGAIAFSLLTYQDAVLSRVILDPALAGNYAAAVTIGRLVLVLVYPMIPVMIPVVTRRAGEGKPVGRVLVFHLLLVAGPGSAAVLVGALYPGFVGGVLLDPAKHSGLGALIPLAFASATFLALTSLTMHFLLALRRRAVIGVLFAAAVACAALILGAPPAPTRILGRVVALAGSVFVVTVFMAAFGSRRAAR